MSTLPPSVIQAYGQLPPTWRLEKLKFFSDVRNSNVDKTINDDEEPVRLCNYTDVYYNDRITDEMEFMQGSATAAEIKKFELKRGQVIITKDSEGWDDIGIPALVTEDMPGVLCGYHLSVLEPRNELDGGFLTWLCRSEPLNDQFKLGANGVTRYGLGQYPMKSAYIAIPPLKTQRRIAQFLDEKTARIDDLIEKKRALLDRLSEKRQALITRAVTKGLNPDAPMKPSGIDWLGDIPAHWEALRLKDAAVRIVDTEHKTAPSVDGGEYFLVRTSNVRDGLLLHENAKYIDHETYQEWTRRCTPEANDLLLTREAPAGEVCLAPPDLPVCLGQRMVLIKTDRKRVHPEYLVQALSGGIMIEFISSLSQGSTVSHFNMSDIGRIPLLLPPLNEQHKIATMLERSLSNLVTVKANVSRSIDALEEYRAALITAAVTGQLEVA